MSDSIVRTPWKDYMGEVPMHLEYFDGSMFEAVEQIAKKYPGNIAFTFMGKSTTYRQMIREIEQCAKALKTIGVREGDKVTIAMPNCPQAIYMFYAVNLVGGIANMIHPLSAEKEIEFYLNASESVAAVTLDQFYNKFEKVRERTKVVNMIIASVRDALSPTIKAGYMLTEGRKIEKIPEDAPVIMWKDFMKLSHSCYYKTYKVKREGADPAVILYSGGTTGTTKGIVLTNKNFNALGQQVIAANPMFRPGDRMLAAMPLFHGFGLGVCVHTMLSQGGRCILIPRFTAKSYAKQIVKYKCNFIAGVPTLLRSAAAPAEHGRGEPQLAQGRILRRRQPVDRAEEEVRQVPLRPQGVHSGARGLRHDRDGHGLLPDAAAHVQGGLHRPAVPGYLHQDRRAGH